MGAQLTDAERQLIWLQRQVGPVVNRLVKVYGLDGVLAVVVGTRDPSTLEPIRPEGGQELAAYDAWTIATQEESD